MLQTLYHYANLDDRVKVISFEENQGLVHVLNYGLSIAKGEYIARMDFDDISTPDRFTKQITYMDNHPEIGLCGAAIGQILGDNNTWQYPQHHGEIKCTLVSIKSLTFKH